MQCKAVTIKSGKKKRCQAIAMKGEDYCLFHSKSERAKEARKKRKVRSFDREDLLVELVRDYRAVDSVEGNKLSKLRLRATLSAQIQELLKDLHRIDELTDILRKEGYEV